MSRRQRRNKPKSKQVNTLSEIKEIRNGGSIAIRGFNFQFLYACHQILSSEDYGYSIGMEGIEDIDIIHKNEYIQVKSSINSIDSSKFWDMGVLKNYLEVYIKDSNANFSFVHNSTIKKGHLKSLEQKNYSKESLEYWQEKIEALDGAKDVNIKNFLQKITFEIVNKNTLYEQCKQLLLEKFDLNNGIEEQFLFSLLYHISLWSEERKTIKHQDILQLIQLVQDASSKTPTNEAIKNNLITTVSFDTHDNITDLGYFDGKAAKPIHIGLGLPVERIEWQNKIRESVEEYGVTVVKSSSGQGKSTLAWQVAYELRGFGFDVYQLNYSESQENVESIFDFIETRIKIGQLPIIVVDGLDKRVKKWDMLADRIFDLPVKMIVTTREEDWYRYGLDASKAKLNLVDINLLQDEAESIFSQLKAKNKLHKEVKSWQPVWEKIELKGLLIEYVYLLTHGKMIHERLEQQIKQLNKENDAQAKIEILRIISLADILNIKIQTRKLTSYIEDNMSFESDRDELYKMLEKEYYLLFDKKYVEGLHPVRSQHLVDILHQTISIEESLVSLLVLIEDSYMYEFFSEIPFLVENDDDFLNRLAKIVATKKFTVIVDAIDGLMDFEPYNYWKNNREIYDDVYSEGLIQLFVNFNPPFSDLNTLEEMNKSFQTDTSEYVVNQKNKLSIFVFEDTFVSKFCLQLSDCLNKIELDKNSNYNGLGYLAKWLQKTKVDIPELLTFSDNLLLDELISKKIDEVISLYGYCNIVFPEEYLKFISENKTTLFAILKEKTNSIIVKEQENELYIQYLADLDKTNQLFEESNNRIDVFENIFPEYKKINIEAIHLPFPNEELYKYAIMDSKKAIPKENLFDKFDIHLNVIWRKTIMRQYSYKSNYEWQKYQRNLREMFLKFIKECNKLFEYRLEGKGDRHIYPLYQEVFQLMIQEKEFPLNSRRYDTKEKFEDELKGISDYYFPFKNFMKQFIGIIDGTDSRIPLINLRDTAIKLSKMQESFKNIQDKTYQYFNMSDIEEEEKYWIERLLKTVVYFIETNGEKTQVAKEVIMQWHEARNKQEVDEIIRILETFIGNTGFHIYYSLNVEEKENIREYSIAIEGYEEGDLEDVLYELVDFHMLDIDYVNIIRVQNKEASYGFRIPKAFFEKVQNELDGREYEESEFGNPLPINITEELLGTLNEKVTIESPPDDMPKTAFVKIMYDIWKLTEYRNNLDQENDIENKWLQKNESELIGQIKNKIDTLNNDEKDFIFEIIDEKISISRDEIVEYMNEKLGIEI